jgi:hypothetical protein
LGTTKFGGAWLHHSPMLAAVHHRSNSVAPEFLHIILLHTSFLGRGKTFSNNPSSFIFFSSPAQEVLPLTNLFSPQEKVLIFNPTGENLLLPL